MRGGKTWLGGDGAAIEFGGLCARRFIVCVFARGFGLLVKKFGFVCCFEESNGNHPAAKLRCEKRRAVFRVAFGADAQRVTTRRSLRDSDDFQFAALICHAAPNLVNPYDSARSLRLGAKSETSRRVRACRRARLFHIALCACARTSRRSRAARTRTLRDTEKRRSESEKRN